MTNAQHGRRQQRSCESQLITTICDFVSAIEDRSQTDIILLDFSKAFDKVSHRLLIHKLAHYGITGEVLNWIKAFLSNRTQEVIVDGARSEKCGVTSGVPQGSVLGPLLFLLFINDIPSHTKHSNIRLFADDCMLYRKIDDNKDCDLLQEDLNGLLDWEKKWKMSAVQQMLSMIMNGYSSGQSSYDVSSVYTGTSGNYTSHYIIIISVYLLF